MKKVAPLPPSGAPVSRRRLMQGLVALGTSALWTRGASSDSASLPPLEIPPWTKQQGTPVGTPYGFPSRFEAGVHRMLPAKPLSILPTKGSNRGYTPLQDLHGFITPNGLFFERHHAGIPDIPPTQHRLVVHGLVEREMVFTMEDLLRFPAVSRFYFLECAGNSSSEMGEATGETVQQTHGLMSCCQWTGVPLSTLLKETGLRKKARWILAESADGSAMTRSVPVSMALDDCLLAYAQNGERLRPAQGYPLRLLAPGTEGNLNVKWLRRLEVGDTSFQTRQETSGYTDLLPSGKARQFTFVMEAKSVITWPSGGQQLTERGNHEIRGLAWSGRGKIRRVDVSMDNGRNWRTTNLDTPILPKCFTSFRMPFRWNGKPAIIMSRAIDETGYVQPTRKQLHRARGVNSNYHFNGIQAWDIGSDGRVQNVDNS